MNQPPRGGSARAAAAVFLVSFPLLVAGLGISEMESRAEARIPMVALEVVVTGRVLPPWLLGEPYLNKPPLHHLLVAGAIRLFGRHDLVVVRLPSALCGALALALVSAIARRSGGPAAGWLAASFLFLTFKFGDLARSAELEILLAAATTLGYFGIARALWQGAGARAWWIAAAGTAIAALAKGPAIAVLFPTMLLVAEAITTRSLRPLRGLVAIVAGAVAGTAIYYGPLVAAFGGIDALRERLAFDNVLHRRPFHFYLWQLPLGLLPAGIFLPWMLAGLRAAPRPARSCAIAVGIGVAAFSLSESKQSHYLLPLYPLVAVWAGTTAAPWFAEARPRRKAVTAAIAIAVLAAPVGWWMAERLPILLSADRRPAASQVLRALAADARGRPLAIREPNPAVAWHLDRRDLAVRHALEDVTAFVASGGVVVVDLEKQEALPAQLEPLRRRTEPARDGHTYVLLARD